MQSISASEKKRGRPKTGLSKTIGVRLYPDQMERLEAWVEAHPEPKPSHTEAARRLIDKALSAD